MHSKIVSDKTAKRLAIGGAIGLATGVILTLVALMPLYSKANTCLENTGCSIDFTAEQVGVNLALGLVSVSVSAIITAIVMAVKIGLKNKQ